MITSPSATSAIDRFSRRSISTIRPGEKIGIVGHSGSGKTTLVNLISRFYDVDSAAECCSTASTSANCRPSDLRRNVGVVLQEPFLFRGTICDNLVYGRPDANAVEAIAAARAALAHDFILRTPLGYDTWLGERGAGLSGGERQRVSIARALLYDPKVLILDEATSSVDTESEKAIQEALRRAHPRSHDAGDRPPSEHAARLGPDSRLRPGPTRRTRHARRAHEARRQIRAAGEDSVADSRKTQFESLLSGPADDLEVDAESQPIALDDNGQTDFAPRWFEPDAD